MYRHVHFECKNVPEKRFGADISGMQAFVYLDPKHTGYITDRDSFAEVLASSANLLDISSNRPSNLVTLVRLSCAT